MGKTFIIHHVKASIGKKENNLSERAGAHFHPPIHAGPSPEEVNHGSIKFYHRSLHRGKSGIIGL